MHDPSIKVYDGKYYIYGSHMTGATSEDLHTWQYIGNGYTSDNPLFEDLFNEELTIFDYSGDYGNGGYAVWAEDVIYNEAMGKYVMYFCTSTTYIKSNLCYATADKPEGPLRVKLQYKDTARPGTVSHPQPPLFIVKGSRIDAVGPQLVVIFAVPSQIGIRRIGFIHIIIHIRAVNIVCRKSGIQQLPLIHIRPFRLIRRGITEI